VYCTGADVRICVVGKYPPIQGGVSAQSYWMCRWLAEQGHRVDVVTNAGEVEAAYRIHLDEDDAPWLAPRFRDGAITVWRTEAPTAAYRHIPAGNPTVTKLASLALEAIDAHRSQVVVGFYLEPYAVAAYLAAVWRGLPLVIRHAGSDVARLLALPQLRPCYVEILKAAAIVCARPAARSRLVEIGVPESRILADPGFLSPRTHFHPDAAPLGIDAFLRRLGDRAVDPSAPTIGLYGKMGTVKGTFDLLKSLARLKREGMSFTLLAMTHGSPEDENRLEQAIADGHLEANVRRLPFLPHWRVPSFLRACSVVCVLERGFPIASHAPGTPLEVLACGTPLLVSAEIARKQPCAPRLLHGVNVLIVHDPSDHDELSRVLRGALRDPAALRAVGLRGMRILAEPTTAAEQIRPYEALLSTAISRRSPAAASTRPAPRQREAQRRGEDDERRCWELLQDPHPDVACADVVDELFYRAIDRAEPGPGYIPVLANNVVIRAFSRDMESERDATPHAYAFQHLPFRNRNRVVHLGPVPYLLSTLANGKRCLGDIAEMIGGEHAGAVDSVCAAARALFAEGIITFSVSSREEERPWPRASRRERQNGQPARQPRRRPRRSPSSERRSGFRPRPSHAKSAPRSRSSRVTRTSSSSGTSA
jgi:glycosyltransferase involved in cell wall biosynthesis